jgi:hypothetical protein
LKPLLELLEILFCFFIESILLIVFYFRLSNLLRDYEDKVVKEHMRFGDYSSYKYGLSNSKGNSFIPEEKYYMSPITKHYYIIGDIVLSRGITKDKLSLIKLIGCDLYLKVAEKLWMNSSKVKAEIALLSLSL